MLIYQKNYYMAKSFFKILFLLLFSMNITNCDNTNDTKLASNKISIHFSSQISIISTTKSIITETTFPSSKEIGIYSWGHHTSDGNVNTTLRDDLNNAKYTKVTGSENLVASIDAHYPINSDTLLNIYAYYPYLESGTNPGSLSFNLNNQEDLMWATPILNRGKVSAESAVNLQFNHILSAITIKFKKADDIKEKMILQSISLQNYSPNVQLDIQTGKLAQATTTNPFTIIKDINEAITPQEETFVTDFLLSPIANPTFIVRLSDKDYVIKSTRAFEAGKKQTYEFTIQATDIHITGQINPWVDGGSSNETIYF